MIQLYAHVNDLIPGENPLSGHWNTGWEVWRKGPRKTAFAPTDPPYKEWFWSIVKEGIKYQLQVESTGHIRDGNIRYNASQQNGVHYLPVDPFYLLGLSKTQLKDTYYDSYTIRKNVKAFNIPTRSELAEKKMVITKASGLQTRETLSTIPLADLVILS